MKENTRVIRDAFKDFQTNVMEPEIRTELELQAQNLVYAAIRFRMKAPGKHDFTGNLLNSIVAAVYQNGNFTKAFFSGESGLKQPRYYEMSKGRHIIYWDYEGRKVSFYNAEVDALYRKGIDDAYEFVSTYQPPLKKGFVVVVAYTTEYADFVETQRHTTGFINTLGYATKVFTQMFPKKN